MMNAICFICKQDIGARTRFKPAMLIAVSIVVRIILSGFGEWWFVGDSAVYLVFGTLLVRYIIVHRLDLDNHEQHKVHISSLLRSAMQQQRLNRLHQHQLGYGGANSPRGGDMTPTASNDAFAKSSGPAPVQAAGGFDDLMMAGSQHQIRVTLDEARELPKHESGVRYIWWKLKRWSSYPEFVLGFLTFFFIILLIVVAFIKPSGVPLPLVPLYDTSHEQYKFGVFAFLFVVNSFFVQWTIV
jgi:hypothetical protein